MSVQLEGGRIVLSGDCRIEEAETLLFLLQESADRIVDIVQCRSLHGALLQVLLSTHAKVIGDSDNPFIRNWIASRLPRP